MTRQLKKPAGRHPAQIYDPQARPNAIDYRDGVRYLDDLEIGDAGAGIRHNRKMTIVSQLFPNTAGIGSLAPFTQVFLVMQAPPTGQLLDNCRHRLWSVRFYGCSLIRMGEGGAEKFRPIRRGTGCQSLDIDQVPTPIKGWIRTDDGMFRCFDIIGDRTVEVYGTHITAGFLAPDNAYDLYALPPDGSDDPDTDGIVDQSEVGVTISPIVTNSTQVNDECTRCVSIPIGATGANAVVFPIPPGSRVATISTPYAAGDLAGLTVDFSYIPPTTTVYTGEGASSNIDVTGELVPLGQTRRLNIPNTPFMRFETTGDVPLDICVTFGKEL